MCCLALGVNSVNCYLDNVLSCIRCELCELLFRQWCCLGLGVNSVNCYLDNVLSCTRCELCELLFRQCVVLH